jgi:hypothetical protein
MEQATAVAEETKPKTLEEMTTEELAELFVQKYNSRKSFEQEAKDLKAECDQIEQLLLPRFQEKAVSKMTIKGKTVYIDTRLWGGAEEDKGRELALALKLIGMGDLVKETVNTQTLSSWLREKQEEFAFDPETGKRKPLSPDQLKALLPDVLRPYLKISEESHLRARKA